MNENLPMSSEIPNRQADRSEEAFHPDQVQQDFGMLIQRGIYNKDGFSNLSEVEKQETKGILDRLLQQGRGILPTLKEYVFTSGYPDEITLFSMIADTLSTPDDLNLLIDCLRLEYASDQKDMRPSENLLNAICRHVKSIREKDSHDPRLGVVVDELITLYESDNPKDMHFLSRYFKPLALSGLEIARKYILDARSSLSDVSASFLLDIFRTPQYLAEYHPYQFIVYSEQTENQVQENAEAGPTVIAGKKPRPSSWSQPPSKRPRGIERGDIDHYLRGQERSSLLGYTREWMTLRTIYKNAASAYLRAIGLEKNDLGRYRRVLRNEDKFIASTESLFRNLGQIPNGEKRLLSSDVVALYGLLINGGIESLYQSYIAQLAAIGKMPPRSEERIRQIKIDLAMGFLEQIRKKNGEIKMLEQTDPITIGIEMEFGDPMKKGIILDNTDSIEEIYALKEKIRARGNRYTNPDVLIEQAMDANVHVAAGLSSSQAYILHPERGSGTNPEKYVQELSFLPSSSPRSGLREIVQMATAGGMRNTVWGFHETVGGVDLTYRHTEMMDVLAISVGAGFVRFGETDGPCIEERFTKASDMGTDENENSIEVYFPFHRYHSYSRFPRKKGVSQTVHAVEVRSLPVLTQDKFMSFIRYTDFNYQTAWGVRAKQKNEEELTSKEEVLLGAWEELMRNWRSLLKSRSIKNPGDRQRYGDVGKKVYGGFLYQVNELSDRDTHFQKDARRIVNQYKRSVRPILKY